MNWGNPSNHMISYAQNFEDVMLRRVFRDKKDGFYIDIGAMDPITDSVTKFFYDEGWSGINIEPNAFFYNRLLAERPRDINLKLAVGEHEETRTFHVFEQFGNSTFNEGSRDSFAAAGYESCEEVVRVTTLAAVCREYVKRDIDFLKIDCEGWEKNVLEGADWDRFRPTILVIEATEPGTTTPAWQEWEHILTQNDRYEMVYFDGLNRFYLRREYRDLRAHFATPPNVFDGFTTQKTATAEQAFIACNEERHQAAGQIASISEKYREQESALRLTEEQLRAVQERLLKSEQSLEAVRAERDALSQRANETRVEHEKTRREIERLQVESAVLAQDLQTARRWVGQLSQDSAAKNLR